MSTRRSRRNQPSALLVCHSELKARNLLLALSRRNQRSTRSRSTSTAPPNIPSSAPEPSAVTICIAAAASSCATVPRAADGPTAKNLSVSSVSRCKLKPSAAPFLLVSGASSGVVPGGKAGYVKPGPRKGIGATSSNGEHSMQNNKYIRLALAIAAGIILAHIVLSASSALYETYIAPDVTPAVVTLSCIMIASSLLWRYRPFVSRNKWKLSVAAVFIAVVSVFAAHRFAEVAEGNRTIDAMEAQQEAIQRAAQASRPPQRNAYDDMADKDARKP